MPIPLLNPLVDPLFNDFELEKFVELLILQKHFSYRWKGRCSTGYDSPDQIAFGQQQGKLLDEETETTYCTIT